MIGRVYLNLYEVTSLIGVAYSICLPSGAPPLGILEAIDTELPEEFHRRHRESRIGDQKGVYLLPRWWNPP